MNKEKTEELYALIGKATVKQTKFENTLGSTTYSVYDLMHSANLSTLDKLYQNFDKQKSKLSEGSLAAKLKGTDNSRSINNIEFKMNVVEKIYAYRVDEAERIEKQKLERENAKKKKALLESLKDEKEMEKYKNMTLEEIETQLSSIS